jgi:hypothetical protein
MSLAAKRVKRHIQRTIRDGRRSHSSSSGGGGEQGSHWNRLAASLGERVQALASQGFRSTFESAEHATRTVAGEASRLFATTTPKIDQQPTEVNEEDEDEEAEKQGAGLPAIIPLMAAKQNQGETARHKSSNNQESTLYIKGFLTGSDSQSQFERWTSTHAKLVASHGWGGAAYGYSWQPGTVGSAAGPASGLPIATIAQMLLRYGFKVGPPFFRCLRLSRLTLPPLPPPTRWGQPPSSLARSQTPR